MRIRLNMLIGAVRELAKHGPMKPTEEQGLDDVRVCFIHLPSFASKNAPRFRRHKVASPRRFVQRSPQRELLRCLISMLDLKL